MNTTRTASSLIILIVVVLIVAAFLAGCVGPSATADGAGVRVGNSAANIARQDDSSWETAIYGPFPTNTVIDDDGANVQTGGPNTVLGLVLSDDAPKLFTSNPADTTFDELTYDRATGLLSIKGFRSQKSTVITAYDQQVLAWAQLQGVISEQQAAVASKLVEGGMSALEAITTILGGL